jgi:hypothetical protein
MEEYKNALDESSAKESNQISQVLLGKLREAHQIYLAKNVNDNRASINRRRNGILIQNKDLLEEKFKGCSLNQ